MPEDKEAVKGGARDDRLSGPVHNHRHREREHVRKLLMAEARDKCHETRAAYVECAKGRTLSLPFYCREPFNAFNDCLNTIASCLPGGMMEGPECTNLACPQFQQLHPHHCIQPAHGVMEGPECTN